MSASLESLMRGTMIDSRPAPLSEGLLSFIAVGGAAVLAFMALSALMAQLLPQGSEWMIDALCFGALVVPAYLLHRRLSFKSETRHRLALPRYVAVEAGMVVLTALFSLVCHQILGMQSVLAGFIAICLTTGANFVALKLWAFAATR